jgi:hypothetical protein
VTSEAETIEEMDPLLLIGIENISHCGNNRATFRKLNISLLYN